MKIRILYMGMICLLLTGCKQNNTDIEITEAAIEQPESATSEEKKTDESIVNKNIYKVEEKEQLNTGYKIRNEASEYRELEKTIDYINELTN